MQRCCAATACWGVSKMSLYIIGGVLHFSLFARLSGSLFACVFSCHLCVTPRVSSDTYGSGSLYGFI
jgi:hypothetical protein